MILSASPASILEVCVPAFYRSPSVSIAHPHIVAGCVADRRELSIARQARRHLLARLALDPFDPVNPPAAFVFGCGYEPILELAGRCFVPPILIFRLAGRIYDACCVARTGEHIADLAAKRLGPDEDRFRRGDMILARRQMVDGYRDFRKIEGLAAELRLALREPVFEIAVAQILKMAGRGYPCRIRVPR